MKFVHMLKVSKNGPKIINMKDLNKIVAAFLLLIFWYNANSQQKCASTVDLSLIQKLDPAKYQRIMNLEQHTQRFVDSVNNPNNPQRLITPGSTIIIPVVVHVLHRGEAVGTGRNISDAQIISQIDVLNEDFRRLNADAVNTPSVFQPVAGDANFEFRLACIDPSGNPTNGITRTFAGVEQFTVVFSPSGPIDEQATKIKFTAQGGKDAWATDRYLNIWVCNMSSFLGYAQFPEDYTVKPNTDGAVVLFNAFGRVGNLLSGYNKGRTCTHEIGHWLNVRHIWGDAVCGNDFVDDTPTQESYHLDCVVFPWISCGNAPNGDMFMNYMDYTNDGCKNIYTVGQALRMRAVFASGGPRFSFIDNYFQISTPVTALCGTTGTVSVKNPNCLPVTWSVASGPVSIIGGQGTNTATLQRTGNGVGVIKASAGGYTDDEPIILGTPQPLTQISVYQQICGDQLQWWLDPVPWTEYATYNWSIAEAFGGPVVNTGQSASGPYYVALNCTPSSVWDISVTPQNVCGLSTTYTATFSNPCGENCGGGGTYRMITNPNPASNQLTVTIHKPSNVISAKETDMVQFEIVDPVSGYTLRRWQLRNNQLRFTLDLSNIKNGVYFLNALIGKNRISNKIIIAR
ncbi:MAG: M43 family zinc metalloprotease [Bacteroidota bacterium]